MSGTPKRQMIGRRPRSFPFKERYCAYRKTHEHENPGKIKQKIRLTPLRLLKQIPEQEQKNAGDDQQQSEQQAVYGQAARREPGEDHDHDDKDGCNPTCRCQCNIRHPFLSLLPILIPILTESLEADHPRSCAGTGGRHVTLSPSRRQCLPRSDCSK